MRKMFAALAIVAVLAAAGTAHAAPIHGVVRVRQSVVVTGLTGEIFIALRGPESILLRSNALPVPEAILDTFFPGEVAYISLNGLYGTIDMGPVVDSVHESYEEHRKLRLVYQPTFTSKLVELGAEIFLDRIEFRRPVPEPATFAFAGIGLLGLHHRRRRILRATPR